MSKRRYSSKSKTQLSILNTQKPGVLANLKSLNLSNQDHETISDIIDYTRQFRPATRERKMSSKLTGLSVLLNGEDSSAKLSVAAFIANELNLKLYRVDLNHIVNKYIGETEKNLNKIFETAIDNEIILFFDEADALFGKRSEVRDAYDKYANLEIGYLLKRLESFEGLVILSSNLKSWVDQDFIKRFRYVIDLPFPETRQR